MIDKIKTNTRKWTTLIIAVITYFIIHEGAHLIYALVIGVLKTVNIFFFGIQIDIFRDQISDLQLGVFCLVGPIATVICSYFLVWLTRIFVNRKSVWLRAITYYLTLAFLIIDPLYLSIVYKYVGGGDMNGISLIVPELIVRIIFGTILILNILIIIKYILPVYKKAFQKFK